MVAKFLTVQNVALAVILAICLATLLILVINEITGRPIDSLVQGLIAFLTGTAATLLGYHAGVNTTTNGGTTNART